MCRTLSRSWLPFIAAAGLVCAQGAGAQVLSVDYGLSTRAEGAVTATQPSPLLSLGSMHLGAALHSDAGYSGVGLSLAAGRNWFAQVSVGQSVRPHAGLDAMGPSEAMRLGGGYRWGDGQSLSLQVTGARGPDRLGLSLSYDWPRYFVRFSYDTGIQPLPQDRLRFSAGVQF